MSNWESAGIIILTSDRKSQRSGFNAVTEGFFKQAKQVLTKAWLFVVFRDSELNMMWMGMQGLYGKTDKAVLFRKSFPQ